MSLRFMDCKGCSVISLRYMDGNLAIFMSLRFVDGKGCSVITLRYVDGKCCSVMSLRFVDGNLVILCSCVWMTFRNIMSLYVDDDYSILCP